MSANLRTSEATEDLLELFGLFSRKVRGRFRVSLEPLGVAPSNARALAIIVHHPFIRMSDLAEALHVSPRSATAMVDALVDSGDVRRCENPDDRRTVCLEPTDKGRDLHDKVTDLRSQMSRDIFADLSVQRQAELREILIELLRIEEGQKR